MDEQRVRFWAFCGLLFHPLQHSLPPQHDFLHSGGVFRAAAICADSAVEVGLIVYELV